LRALHKFVGILEVRVMASPMNMNSFEGNRILAPIREGVCSELLIFHGNQQFATHTLAMTRKAQPYGTINAKSARSLFAGSASIQTQSS